MFEINAITNTKGVSQVNFQRSFLQTRRDLIKGLVFSALTPYTMAAPISIDINSTQLFSAATDNQNKHWLLITSTTGELINKLPLPSRAHQIIKHPFLPLLCVVARRPGRYLLVVHSKTGALIKNVSPSRGHHFYGHGLFSRDGKYLVTSENHMDSGEGRITVRNTFSDFEIANQFSSQGIGPHELKLLTDGQTLVVANGGIKTHPAKGREKLNINSMRPTLTYLNLQTGQLLEQASLPPDLHQLSIRHIDVNSQDQVIIAMQYQGDKTDQFALVASHQRGASIRLMVAPSSTLSRMNQYCGSVCFDSSGKYALVTSPKGDLITLWDMSTHKVLSEARCPDACGVTAYEKQSFLISSGSGKLYHYSIAVVQKQPVLMKTKQMQISSPKHTIKMAWDNHLTLSI